MFVTNQPQLGLVPASTTAALAQLPRLPTPLRLGLVWLIAASLPGCSFLVDADSPQCRTDADCTARGSNFASAVCEQELCVVKVASGEGNLQCQPAVSNGLPTVKYSFALQLASSAGSDTAMPFQVQACAQLDVNCERPLAGPFEVPAGVVYDFPLPQGFSGFLEIVNPGALPALYFMPRPIVADTVGWSPTILSQEVVAQLAGAANVSLDPASGVLLASVRDCAGVPVAGATILASEEQAIRYYVVNNLPVLSATETGAQGVVGFANVPDTTIALNGFSSTGKNFASVSVRVKAGFLSLVEMRP